MRQLFFGIIIVVLLFTSICPIPGGNDLPAAAAGTRQIVGKQSKIQKGVLPTKTNAKANVPVVKEGIPILMYHEIGDYPNSLYVSENDFRQQMYYLRDHGYRVLNVKQALEVLQKKESIDKTVAVSFDDGYISFYNKVYPILKECKFSATVFVVTNLLSIPNYITWEQASILARDGIEIGSHTQNHVSLPSQSDAQLIQEIAGSRQLLEQKLGIKIESFCYPFGDCNWRTAEYVKAAGYLTATTTANNRTSLQDDPYLFPRIKISRGISIGTFAKRL
ncbi:MAG: polysaccharide deacetylase family protein [Syntrophomonas sp.]